MIIFTNKNRNYPICGLDDLVLGVSYHTGPKGWMNQSIFFQYFIKPHAYQPDLHYHTKSVWVNNCTAYHMTPTLVAITAQKHSTLKYLPLCATHPCQPADTFFISNIKDTWTKQWEAKKSKLIQENTWQNNPRSDGQWLKKLTNLSKRLFLQLAANAIEDVNWLVNSDNMSYAEKAMIRCSLSLEVDGNWSINHLFPHLQEIIAKHHQYF